MVETLFASSSGMWPQAMEPDVSIRYMTLGFTVAVVLLASGTLEMSVTDAAASPATKQNSVAAAIARRARSERNFLFVSIAVMAPPLRASVHDRLDVAGGVSRSCDAHGDAEIGLDGVGERQHAVGAAALRSAAAGGAERDALLRAVGDVLVLVLAQAVHDPAHLVAGAVVGRHLVGVRSRRPVVRGRVERRVPAREVAVLRRRLRRAVVRERAGALRDEPGARVLHAEVAHRGGVRLEGEVARDDHPGADLAHHRDPGERHDDQDDERDEEHDAALLRPHGAYPQITLRSGITCS